MFWVTLVLWQKINGVGTTELWKISLTVKLSLFFREEHNKTLEEKDVFESKDGAENGDVATKLLDDGIESEADTVIMSSQGQMLKNYF